VTWQAPLQLPQRRAQPVVARPALWMLVLLIGVGAVRVAQVLVHSFTTPPNLQHAVAVGLGLDDSYFRSLGPALARSRDRLAAGLAALDVPVLACDGTYFLVLDVTKWLRPDEDDIAFCRRLVVEGGVVLIPMSAFYESSPPRHLVRACFCKEDATIDAALQRLHAWASSSR